jgi:hypothetical protein
MKDASAIHRRRWFNLWPVREAERTGRPPWRHLAAWATLLALAVFGPSAARAAEAAKTSDSAPTGFRFAPVDDKSMGLWEGTKPVLVYNHGVISRAGVPADRNRSTYVHPLYGLDGEVLTDDFPADHHHHRGLFWAWPHVSIGGKHYDLWMLSGIQQRFERWLAQAATNNTALLGVENGWYVGEQKVMAERVWLRVLPATSDQRILDLDFTWTPLGEAVGLAGAEGKSYGGLTLRFAPRTNTVITTTLGNGSEDLPMTRLAWADLSAKFAGTPQPSGASIFIAPDHPNYPPMWLTRHYGVLCVGWPGVEAKTFKAGEPIRCRYRVWIHRGAPDGTAVARAYDAYVADLKAGRDWTQPGASSPRSAGLGPRAAAPAAQELGAQPVRAEAGADRVSVRVAGKLFTEYLFGSDTKYPYFFPVNGPASGVSVTAHRTEPYPHHSSVFFGCDRVNGGNYWQEGLERGRIVSKAVRLIRDAGSGVVFEQTCLWERPGAPAPFDDQRRIGISAPTPDLRLIDFEVTLTARTPVRIEKTNHSLFAARMAPELSVQGGGSILNALGDSGEQATFGKRAAWADYQGKRAGGFEGLAILCHPDNPGYPPPWFTRDYGFMSPTPMNWLEGGFLELATGEQLHLRYRVIVHSGDRPPAQFETWLREWTSRGRL